MFFYPAYFSCYQRECCDLKRLCESALSRADDKSQSELHSDGHSFYRESFESVSSFFYHGEEKYTITRAKE